jgi:alanine-glyoxylate transaminase/serine-glyoxylate transaminase/serine-pyruvate transaminase
MSSGFEELNVPARLLLGPGPSNVHPRVYRAMMTPVIGYLDPQFIQLLDDTQRPLRTLFGTENDMTIAISGTGTAGMEAAVYNVVEPGDTVIGSSGIASRRWCSGVAVTWYRWRRSGAG